MPRVVNDSVSTPASEYIFETSEVMHNEAIDININAEGCNCK